MGENICIYLSYKGLASRTYKELLELKASNLIKEQVKNTPSDA